jgi:hypothetical protein
MIQRDRFVGCVVLPDAPTAVIGFSVPLRQKQESEQLAASLAGK